MKRLYFVGVAPGDIPNGDVSPDINPQFDRDLGLVGAAVDLNEAVLRTAGISVDKQEAISHIMGNTLMALLHELGIEAGIELQDILRARAAVGARIGGQAVTASSNGLVEATSATYPHTA